MIEDDLDIAGNIGDFLEAAGHQVDFAYDGISGLHLALTREFDVIVIDWMLPGMAGTDLCRKLRNDAQCRVPALMLTARDTLADKLEGFESGVDDYLVKPFALQELEARLRALDRLRRSAPRELTIADLVLDPVARTVRRGGQRLGVHGAAFEILRLLMERSPGVVRREELEGRLWGDDPPQSDVLRSHIYALRRTIDKPFDRDLLHTVRGYGYQIAAR